MAAPASEEPRMASSFHTHQGTTALSDSRRDKLVSKLASKIGAKDITARYIHYVALDGNLDETKKHNLNYLLTYNSVPPSKRDVDSVSTGQTITLYTSPRKGTISPWSSKATSIAHVCGFDNVVRIERGMVYTIFVDEHITGDSSWKNELYDRMTEEISQEQPSLEVMFAQHDAAPATVIPISSHHNPKEVLQDANKKMGGALDASEIEYLSHVYGKDGQLHRNPYLEELFMFAQINSEHCRHKQFNASWTIDNQAKDLSLFDMIRNTYRKHPEHVISAYSDNAAVIEGSEGSFLAPNPTTGVWTATKEKVHFLAKVETHNHPTAVSPFPGAATGSGGEIRDEGAVGRGSRPKAGLCGFTVSDLNIPGFSHAWETDIGKPDHIASSLDIMIDGPLGAASFNNEFGRPCTTGFFRTFTTTIPLSDGKNEVRGYHKPIMIAGGIGSVRPQLALKDPSIVKPGSITIVLGGPAMLIGLGGGAASSVASNEDNIELDFASVQRGNAEVQRRAQEVINACAAMGTSSPILFIHDVGAGGLSNALPELVHDAGLGATFELREIDNADRSMSPMQIWSCEAQERYVMAVAQESLELFKKIADRERCGYSIVGKTTGESQGEKRLILLDRDSPEHPKPIDLPMSVLFGKAPRMKKVVETRLLQLPAFDSSLSQYLPTVPKDGLLTEAVQRVLALPSVGSKSFLITIGDRTVGGLMARDQMVGPWQVPVADVSVIATSLMRGTMTGEAMAMGERPILSLVSPAASARMAVVESLTNLVAADLLGRTERVHLSANWMSASSHPGEGAAIYEAVEAIGLDLCPKLGISIPVGKDSMSMKMKWTDKKTKEAKEVTAPLSLVITAFAPVRNVKNTWTPALRRLEDVGETVILFVDLAKGRQALGGSALAQVFGQVGNVVPDVHDVQLIRDYFDAMEQLQDMGIVLAYHDRSDGGLFTTLTEMMFAGRCGLEVMTDSLSPSKSTGAIMEALFNEELGGVFQVRKKDEIEFNRAFATCGPPRGLIKKIGRVPAKTKQELAIYHYNSLVFRAGRAKLQQRWAATSYHIQRLRDNPACANSEYASIVEDSDPGLSFNLTFSAKDNILPLTSYIPASLRNKPKVAILREQGINGAPEMSYAFMSAGFETVDVHMTDLFSGRTSLAAFSGLAACGGFSYGDVLGAGLGWAKSVLLHPGLRNEFQTFFERPDSFTLGVCNGCQFLTHLKSLIPGANSWPTFERNDSEQYEARVCMVEIAETPLGIPDTKPNIFLHGMGGSTLPIAVAHGEGRARFPALGYGAAILDLGLVAMRYVDNNLNHTQRYPANPNGSKYSIAAVQNQDGRVMAMMPHPERVVLMGGSYVPDHIQAEWTDSGPWIRLFQSARRWVG